MKLAPFVLLVLVPQLAWSAPQPSSAPAAPRARIIVRSDPPGAAVLLDGAPVGTTDLTLEVAPGHHRVIVEAPRFERYATELDVKPGATQTVAAALTPLPPPPGPPRSLRWVKWVLAATAAVGVGTGAFLLLRTPGESTVNEQGVLVDEPHNSSTAGIILLSVGGAAAIAAIVTFLWDAQR